MVYSPDAPEPIGPYSQAIAVGKTLYCSGQIPVDPASGQMVEGDVKAQTTRVCENIRAVLSAAGHRPEDVVKTTCYLTDMADFAAMNEVYAAFFTGKPARSCVAVKALPKNALVEIEVLSISP